MCRFYRCFISSSLYNSTVIKQYNSSLAMSHIQSPFIFHPQRYVLNVLYTTSEYTSTHKVVLLDGKRWSPTINAYLEHSRHFDVSSTHAAEINRHCALIHRHVLTIRTNHHHRKQMDRWKKR